MYDVCPKSMLVNMYFYIQKGFNLSERVILSMVPGYWMKICCVSARAVIAIGANKNDPYLGEVS